jgi:hypothetical protein
MMKPQTEYLLFLNAKQYIKQENRPAGDTYIILDNPFGKLTVSKTTSADYKKPPANISLRQSLAYEIMLNEDVKIKRYFNIKNQILKYLHLI